MPFWDERLYEWESLVGLLSCVFDNLQLQKKEFFMKKTSKNAIRVVGRMGNKGAVSLLLCFLLFAGVVCAVYASTTRKEVNAGVVATGVQSQVTESAGSQQEFVALDALAQKDTQVQDKQDLQRASHDQVFSYKYGALRPGNMSDETPDITIIVNVRYQWHSNAFTGQFDMHRINSIELDDTKYGHTTSNGTSGNWDNTALVSANGFAATATMVSVDNSQATFSVVATFNGVSRIKSWRIYIPVNGDVKDEQKTNESFNFK